MEKEAKIIIPFHPKVSQEQINEAKKHCQTFRTILKAEGRSIEVVEVTWSLNNGLLGSLPPYGILVTRNNQPQTTTSLSDNSELIRGKIVIFDNYNCDFCDKRFDTCQKDFKRESCDK